MILRHFGVSGSKEVPKRLKGGASQRDKGANLKELIIAKDGIFWNKINNIVFAYNTKYKTTKKWIHTQINQWPNNE